jgi:hypothetical protein
MWIFFNTNGELLHWKYGEPKERAERKAIFGRPDATSDLRARNLWHLPEANSYSSRDETVRSASVTSKRQGHQRDGRDSR